MVIAPPPSVVFRGSNLLVPYTHSTHLTVVDANMRELRATGFMSNRGRQVVASFLTKDMLIDWRWGAAYFEVRQPSRSIPCTFHDEELGPASSHGPSPCLCPTTWFTGATAGL